MATKVGCGNGMVWQAVGDGGMGHLRGKFVEGHGSNSNPLANVDCRGADRKVGGSILLRRAMELCTYFCPRINKVVASLVL